MKSLFRFALLMLALVPALHAKDLVNLDKDGLAVKGYDPVAFFKEGKPVKGQAQFVAIHKGATYRFASAENRDEFKKTPDKYEPQFGGYCAWAVSRGYTADIEPDAFMIVNNRLLLQYSQSVREMFQKDSNGNLSKADQNWPSIVEKKGK